MKKLFLFLSIMCIGFSMISCGKDKGDSQTEVESEYPTQPDPTVPGGETPVVPTPTPVTPVVPTPTPVTPDDGIIPDSTITDKLMYIDIEVGETYNISSLLKEFPNMTVSFDDTTLASYASGVITGKTVGVTKVTLSKNGSTQTVRLEVHAKGALAATFTFDEYRLQPKIQFHSS